MLKKTQTRINEVKTNNAARAYNNMFPGRSIVVSVSFVKIQTQRLKKLNETSGGLMSLSLLGAMASAQLGPTHPRDPGLSTIDLEQS